MDGGGASLVSPICCVVSCDVLKSRKRCHCGILNVKIVTLRVYRCSKLRKTPWRIVRLRLSLTWHISLLLDYLKLI
jgi:hypothetical protein